jgi:hypothetical protein
MISWKMTETSEVPTAVFVREMSKSWRQSGRKYGSRLDKAKAWPEQWMKEAGTGMTTDEGRQWENWGTEA